MSKHFFNIILGCVVAANIGYANYGKDTAMVNSLNNESYDYLGSLSLEKAFITAKESRQLAQSIGYADGEILALCRMGNTRYYEGRADSALSYYNKAEQLFYEVGVDSALLIKIYAYQAPMHNCLGRPDLALAKNRQVYQLAIENGENSLAVAALLNIAQLLKSKANYSEALGVIHKAIDIVPQTNYDQLGAAYNGIANIYEDQGRIEEAIEALNKAQVFFYQSKNNADLLKTQINLGNFHYDLDNSRQAMLIYQQVFDVASSNNFKEIAGIASQNIGAIYLENGMLDSARLFFNKSVRIKNEIDDPSGLLESLKSISHVFILKNKIDSAVFALKKAKGIAVVYEDIESLQEITRNLSECHQKNGDWKTAMDYLRESRAYQDTLSQQLTKGLIYEVNYEQEKRKVSELELILKERDLQLQKQYSWIWIILVIALSLIAILLVFLRLNKQKRRAAEIEKENVKKQKEISDLISRQEQAELKAMFSGQESERNRIATELHDDLGSILSVVKLYFKSIDKQINQLKAENIQEFYKANDLLDDACDRTRRIAHKLSSKNLKKMGLFATVKRLKRQISDSNELNFTLSTHGTDEKLEHLNQISIYRIIQELVNNIIKHAQANEINVQLNVFQELFNLIIEDDGIGFDVNKMIDNSGIGLRETEARVKHMNGKLTIDSGRGGGTTITIDIPLNTKQ